MFIKISIRAQFLLLSMFLEEKVEGDYSEELSELVEGKYLDDSLNITKKGQAYCHIQNYVGVNFKSLIEGNSRRANLTLATQLLIHINNKNSKDIVLLTKKLPTDIQDKINQFFQKKNKQVVS